MNFPDSNIELVGEYIQYKDLLPIAQQYVKNFDGLVVIREKELPMEGRKRAVGTLWYKNQLLGFTVEDITREEKIKGQTAIPANLTFISPPSKGYYNIVLDKTGVPELEPNYVKFPNDKREDFKTGVMIRVGTNESATKIEGNPNLSFDGVRIHHGGTENYSAGCLIYSRQRFKDGTVLDDKSEGYQINQTLIKYVYFNNINKIVYIDYFNLSDNTDYNLRGKVINKIDNQFLKGAKINITTTYSPSTPESLKEIYSFTFSTTTNENGEFNIRISPIIKYIISNQTKNIYDKNSSFEVSFYSPGFNEMKKKIVDGNGDYTPDLGIIGLEPIVKLNPIPLSELTLEDESTRYKDLLSTPQTEINAKLTKQKGKLNDLVKNMRDNIITTFFS